EAEIPHRHQTLDGLLVDLFERTVALLMVAHTVGEDVVGRAAVAVFLEVVKRLRGGAGAEQQHNTRSRCEHLHERRSLISRSWRRYWRPVEPNLLQARIVHPRRPSRAPTVTTGGWLARRGGRSLRVGRIPRGWAGQSENSLQRNA